MPESSRQLLGTLIVVPLVVVVLGSEWTWTCEFWPVSVQRLRTGAVEGALSASSEAGKLSFFADGAPADRGLELGPSEAIEFSFQRPHRRVRLVLQADSNDSYRVSTSGDGKLFEPVWMVPQASGNGLRTRTSPPLTATSAVRRLRIEPVDGDGTCALSGLMLVEDHRFVHALLIPILFLTWAGLGTLRHLRFGKRFAEWALVQWRRFDAWIAGVLIFAVLFEVPASVVPYGLWLLGFISSLRVLHLCVGRLGTARALTAFVAVPLAFIVLVTIGASIILAQIGKRHELNVDHRLVPGGEINEDGIRFRGPASLFTEEDYVLIFLGDSFTYGSGVDYEKGYPYLLERLLSTLDCKAAVRVANFGWGSSSPLLSYRLLRDVGHKYRPDLVVYNLDMTDFSDDLRYEAELRLYGDLGLPKHILLTRMLLSLLPSLSLWEDGLLPTPRAAARESEELAVRAAESAALEQAIPRGRYFVTDRPLADSRAAIERGVARNLERIFRHSETNLGSKMLLVILPRAFQYSDRESTDNWESDQYEALGPFVREPFRYFEEAREELPYPVFSLLSHFEEAAEFPLYQKNDPHWTEAGNRVAAAGLLEYLVHNRLVPCVAPTTESH